MHISCTVEVDMSLFFRTSAARCYAWWIAFQRYFVLSYQVRFLSHTFLTVHSALTLLLLCFWGPAIFSDLQNIILVLSGAVGKLQLPGFIAPGICEIKLQACCTCPGYEKSKKISFNQWNNLIWNPCRPTRFDATSLRVFVASKRSQSSIFYR